MRDNHSIDDLFRETISPYQISPSEKVWNSLDKKLQEKANPRKPQNVSKILVTSAVILGTVSLFVGYYVLSLKNNEAKKINQQVVVPSATSTSPVISANVVDNNSANSAKKENTTHAKNNSTALNTNKNTTQTNIGVANNEFDNSIFYSKPPLLIDGFDKVEPEPFIAADKKDNTDKSILMMPYFPSDHTSNQTDNQSENKPAAKNEIPEAIKTEKTESTLFVPNAFTPNGDGLNDVFIPQTAENIKEYRLYIYDKNSKIVFSSDDIHKGWDGNSQINGVESIKSDIYLWRIELKNSKGEKEHLMGYVNLLNDK